MPEVKSPEDAIREFDTALDAFWLDSADWLDEASDDWVSFASTIVCLLIFAGFMFCAGALIAVAWEASDDVPARGVMDAVR